MCNDVGYFLYINAKWRSAEVRGIFYHVLIVRNDY